LARFVPDDVLASYNSIAKLNNNFDKLAILMESVVFRDGRSNNSMLDHFDMNHFAINNVADGVALTDAVNLGQLQAFVDFYVANISKGVPGSPGEGYASRDDIADIVAPAILDDVYLTEPGREGKFVFSTANLSDLVGVDTEQALYIAPTSDPTGASGAWVRITDSGDINIKWFGADITGVAPADTAFNAFIAYANFVATGTAGTYNGVSCLIPDGIWRIDGDLDEITGPAISFRGMSRAAVIRASNPGSLFTWTNDAWGGGLDRLTIEYTGAPDDTSSIITISGARDQVFVDLELYNFNTLAVLGTAADATASAIWFDRVNGFCYNSGKPTFDVRYGSALFLNSVSIYVEGVPVPTFDTTSTMATVAGTNFIELTHGGWDTITLNGGCNCNRYDHGLYINAPGSVISNIWVGDSIIDFCSGDAISLNAATNAMGGIFHVNIGQAYIVSWSGCGIKLTGNNPNAQHDFNGANIYISGQDAIDIGGLGTRDIKIRHIRLFNVGRTAGSWSGVILRTCQGYIDMNYITVKQDPAAVLPWGATYGITVVPDMNHYQVTGCYAIGSTRNYNIDPDTTLSTTRLVRNNQFADYAGMQTTGLYNIPASATNWENTTPFEVEVTVTGMNLGLGKGAADFTPMTEGTWSLAPGETLFVSYDAGLEKMFFDVKP
jgi:hypothetical protein